MGIFHCAPRHIGTPVSTRPTALTIYSNSRNSVPFRRSPPPPHTSSVGCQSRVLSNSSQSSGQKTKTSQILMPRQPDIDQGKENGENQSVPKASTLEKTVSISCSLDPWSCCPFLSFPSLAVRLLFPACEPSHSCPVHCLWLRVARAGFCCLQPKALRSSNIPSIPL